MTKPSGLILDNIDPAYRPQDNLYYFMNGKWLENFQIPADRSSDGCFRELYDQAEVDVRNLIEAAAKKDAESHEEYLIGTLYALFMDKAGIDAKGIAPILPILAEIDQLDSHDQALRFMFSAKSGISLFDTTVWTDAKNSSRYILYLGQSGLGLPDEAYYREDDQAELREKYVAHLAEMARLGAVVADDAAAKELADKVMEFETQLAKLHWDKVSCRDADKTYNLMTNAELREFSPKLNWDTFREAVGLSAENFAEVVLSTPSFFQDGADVFVTTDLEVIKQWLAVHTVRAFAPYLNEELAQAQFNFRGKIINGIQEMPERWKRGVSFVQDSVGEAVGKLFVAAHFPPENKARMQDLVAQIIEAYRVSISKLEWMTEQTRARALEKLSKFTTKIGYPDQWRDYSGLEVDTEDLVNSLIKVHEFESAYKMSRVLQPVDPHDWHMTPQTVNAYYNPTANEIVFPAAFLRPPMFDAEADLAANFGGIGAVIAHEVGHGFDDQGSKYDGDGNLESWWTKEDRDAFEARTKALIDQYDRLVPPGLRDDELLSGAFTIGENIGDLGGLGIAVQAYQASLNGEEAPVIDGYTGLQRVFLGWAQIWRSKHTPEDLRLRLKVDPHSPTQHRCNQIVRNVKEFYEAFDVKEGDELYLAPEERVSIWQ